MGGTVKARVTARDRRRASSADTSVTAVVTGSPANTVAPTITGTTGIGDTLTEHDGTWSGFPAPTFSYQWTGCDSAGATAPHRRRDHQHVRHRAGDAGYRIRVTVTATNASGSPQPTAHTADVTRARHQPGRADHHRHGTGRRRRSPPTTARGQVFRTDIHRTCGSAATRPARTAPTSPRQRRRRTTRRRRHRLNIAVVVSANNAWRPAGPSSAATPAVVAAPPFVRRWGGGSGVPPDVVARSRRARPIP